MTLKKAKGKQSLKPGVATVLIGFKGPIDLKTDIARAAKRLGLSYSELLRVITEEFVTASNKLHDPK